MAANFGQLLAFFVVLSVWFGGLYYFFYKDKSPKIDGADGADREGQSEGASSLGDDEGSDSD
jgi:hypothetical protein